MTHETSRATRRQGVRALTAKGLITASYFVLSGSWEADYLFIRLFILMKSCLDLEKGRGMRDGRAREMLMVVGVGWGGGLWGRGQAGDLSFALGQRTWQGERHAVEVYL